MKLLQRARITPDFLDAMRCWSRQFLAGKEAEWKGAARNPWSRRWQEQNRPAIARAKGWHAQRPDFLDTARTRLRCMRYTLFDARELYGERYLVLETQDIHAADLLSKERWDLGPYDIYIPLGADSYSEISMAPRRDPLIWHRHMHHVRDGLRPCFDEYEHPVQDIGSTCVSEFGSPLLSSIQEFDLVELFAYLHLFLSTFYSGSPLSRHGWKEFALRLN